MSKRVAERPPRPAIPTVIWGLVAVIVVQRVILDAGREQSVEGALAASRVFGALGCLLSACVVLSVSWHCVREGGLVRKRQGEGSGPELADTGGDGLGQLLASTMLVLLACSCIGASVAERAVSQQILAQQALMTSPLSSWRLEVVSDASDSQYGYRCTARAEAPGMPRALVTISMQQALERGQVVSCVGRFAPLAQDDYGISAWRRGVVGSVRIIRVMETFPADGVAGAFLRLRASVLEVIEPTRSDSRALLAGIVCGDRSPLDQRGLGEVFAACGLAHVVAVSGAHIAIVASICTSLLMRSGCGLRRRIVLLALATGSFVLMCGAPPSAVRAWLMALAANVSQLVGRRSHALSSVGAVALAMAMGDPCLSGQLGFLLSVISVAALALYGRYASYALDVLVGPVKSPSWMPRAVRKGLYGALDGVRTTLAATTVCQIAAMPLVVSSFGEVSVIAPVANLVVAPLVALLLAMGMGVVVLAPLPPVCEVVLFAFDALCTPMLAILCRMSATPMSTLALSVPKELLAVLVLTLGVLVYAWWPRPSRRLVICAMGASCVLVLACLVRWRYLAPARIVVMDVGQGDAILVQDGGSAILIDTGPDESVAAALARCHVLHLDAVIITHLHDDHYGGLCHLTRALRCDRVIVAQGVTDHMEDEIGLLCDGLTGSQPLELSYGETIAVGGFCLRMVWPRTGVAGDENRDSIELTVSYDRDGKTLTALMTGDAEWEETLACIRAGDVDAVDLLKVGHHGSELSLDPESASVLHPLVAVASAGKDNEYGHPRPECVEMLEAVGSRFLCTKDVGDVEVRPGRLGLSVRCQRRVFAP